MSIHKFRTNNLTVSMHTYVLPHGLEPWTSRLLAERSNQLSYESSRAAISPAVWQTHITISSKRLWCILVAILCSALMFLVKRGNAQNSQTTRFSFSTLAEQCGYSTLAEHYFGGTTSWYDDVAAAICAFYTLNVNVLQTCTWMFQ